MSPVAWFGKEKVDKLEFIKSLKSALQKQPVMRMKKLRGSICKSHMWQTSYIQTI